MVKRCVRVIGLRDARVISNQRHINCNGALCNVQCNDVLRNDDFYQNNGLREKCSEVFRCAPKCMSSSSMAPRRKYVGAQYTVNLSVNRFAEFFSSSYK